MIVLLVSPAAKASVPLSLRVNFTVTSAMSTATGTVCAGLRVAVSVAVVGGVLLSQAPVAVPLALSQMLAGLTENDTAARWSAAVRPYFRAGYCDAVPKSHPSCTPFVPESRSTFHAV